MKTIKKAEVENSRRLRAGRNNDSVLLFYQFAGFHTLGGNRTAHECMNERKLRIGRSCSPKKFHRKRDLCDLSSFQYACTTEGDLPYALIYPGSPFAKTLLFKGGIQRLLRPLGSMPNGRNDVNEREAPDFRPGRMCAGGSSHWMLNT